MTSQRTEPDVADIGVEGNSRLTATTGTLLTLILFVEGLTIVQIRGLITLHIFIGLVLIGPVALKCATTGYRFARYYSGRPAYVDRGPPPALLRALGPVVIVTSVAVLATGAGLLAVRPGSAGLLVFAHKASFAIWFVAMTVHVLGHVREAVVGTVDEVRPTPGDPASQRRAVRAVALLVSLMVGVGVAAAFTPAGSDWSHSQQWEGQ